MKVDHQFPVDASRSGTPMSVEVVARYFRDLAARGLGCASNNGSVAMALGLSAKQVVEAKRALIDAGRLVGRWGIWQSIDGVRFGGDAKNDLESLKNVLRRHRYSPVCDARVVDNPNAVPHGQVTELLVGNQRMTLRNAEALARELEGEK